MKDEIRIEKDVKIIEILYCTTERGPGSRSAAVDKVAFTVALQLDL